MRKSFRLEVAAPDREILSTDVSAITVPGAGGEFGVWARHEPLVSALKPGAFTVVENGERRLYFVSGGFIEVTPVSATVLVEEFEPVEDIDAEREEKNRKHATEKMAKSKDAVEKEAAHAARRRAEARLLAVQKSKEPFR
ncbi:MAG: ATP synthase F1 subunit epsilon [bacterium]